jgi:hypothetical protein
MRDCLDFALPHGVRAEEKSQFLLRVSIGLPRTLAKSQARELVRQALQEHEHLVIAIPTIV